MAMDMAALPKKGAHAYFSAAIRQGYRRMLVLANEQFYYFWTKDAQQKYVTDGRDAGNIGLIEECCCVACGCDAWGKKWWFWK